MSNQKISDNVMAKLVEQLQEANATIRLLEEKLAEQKTINERLEKECVQHAKNNNKLTEELESMVAFHKLNTALH